MAGGNPIVIAYHLIWTVYGWWLPNDPRGSGSHTVASDILAQLGELHHGRKRLQPAGAIVGDFYDRAGDVLKFPLMTFTPAEMGVVGQAVADAIAAHAYTCWACAIMPDHVHMVIRKHRDSAEQMIDHLKSASADRLRQHCPRWSDHPTWAGGGGWKVFLDHPDEAVRTIKYVNANPRQARLPRQCWPFVLPYDRWPLHPGHSPNSPYAKALRRVGRYP